MGKRLRCASRAMNGIMASMGTVSVCQSHTRNTPNSSAFIVHRVTLCVKPAPSAGGIHGVSFVQLTSRPLLWNGSASKEGKLFYTADDFPLSTRNESVWPKY